MVINMAYSSNLNGLIGLIKGMQNGFYIERLEGRALLILYLTYVRNT